MEFWKKDSSSYFQSMDGSIDGLDIDSMFYFLQ